MLRISFGIVLLFGLLSPIGAGAQEHPMLKRGLAQYEAADLDAALSTFNAAARNADLSVEELLQLFEMRALVNHALADAKAMREDLRRIAAVRPSYRLGTLAPPPVRQTFEEVLATSPKVELRIEQRKKNGATSMVAKVVEVPDGLVDHVTLTCLVGHDDAAISHTSQGVETEVPLPDRRSRNQCDATARTRQGGVLFRGVAGEARSTPQSAPVMFQLPESVPYTNESAKKKKKRWPWFVAAAAVVVVAAGVTAGVVASKGSDDGQTLGGATVSW